MGHTLLAVLGLFCEYICDFLCDVQYLYQCSSCADMTFVADLSWFRLEDYVKYITQLVTFALVLLTYLDNACTVYDLRYYVYSCGITCVAYFSRLYILKSLNVFPTSVAV